MSLPSKAVFLSYASEDAAAAHRICEALRGEGLEVWFDRSELRGGDAWDASIRQQIKDCALFLPVISSNTQARTEGYFRLEWRLAEQRSHLMAKGRPFIVPVVIDDTADAGAHVPDAFLEVQWSQLPDGRCDSQFAIRIRQLTSGEIARPGSAGTGSPSAGTVATPRGSRWLKWIVAAALVVPAGGLLVALAPSVVKLVREPARESPPVEPPPSVARETVAPATTVASSETIAVLPFANLSPDKADQYFSEGFSEEILNTLSRIPGLRVTARTASFSFKGKDATTREIAARLGVNYLVEGSVRRTGEQARIIVQLVKGADGFPVWSETYTRDVNDMYSVQSDVAFRVARSLKLRLGNAADEKLASVATRIPAAYEAYLRGREAVNRGSADDLRDAARLLLQAVTLDPGFALAHGRLAETYISMGNIGAEPRDKAFPLAKASAERALALDERNVQAHTALGEYAFHYAWEWEESDRHLRRALAIDPNYFPAVFHQGSHDMARNRNEDALASFRRARELNPLGSSAWILSALIRMKRYDEAIQLGRREVAAQPAFTGQRIQLAMAQFLNGQQEDGLRALEAMIKPEQGNVRDLARLGWCYGMAGQKDKARAILKRLQEAAKSQRAAPDFIATVHVGLGERDRAFELLERAYAQREPSMPLIGSEYQFDPIHDDPRFRSLLKRMNLDAYFPEAPVR